MRNGCVAFFLSFRERLVGSYPELFESVGADTLSAVSQFGAKWGWYQSLYTLANGDVTRLEDITELSAHKCFMMLAFVKEKNELEARQLNKKI